MKKNILSVSILGTDLTRTDQTIKMLEDVGCSMVHLDVMDGHFVPNLTFGPDFVKSVKDNSKLIVDTHLMIDDVEQSLQSYIKTGSDYITVHAESAKHLHYCVKLIKEAGLKAGVALNPATSVYVLDEILPFVDLVLVMSVNPGFSGQSFIETSLDKIAKIKKMREEKNYNFVISVDGGAGLNNIVQLRSAGVDFVVSASAFFKNNDKKDFIKQIEG